MTQLSVNVNKLATIRNSRGKNLPDVTAFARKILGYGAHGITVHPRPDGRHIRLEDVRELRRLVDSWPSTVEFNVEGYPSSEFIQLLAEVKPHQATLVPDPPEALTSNAGWNLESAEVNLTRVVHDLRDLGIRSSLFVDPQHFTRHQRDALKRIRPDRIELYTERYADEFGRETQDRVIDEYRLTAEQARDLGVGVNAGHDLNQKNLGTLIRAIPWIDEVSIGHALVCEALDEGMEITVRKYLSILSEANA